MVLLKHVAKACCHTRQHSNLYGAVSKHHGCWHEHVAQDLLLCTITVAHQNKDRALLPTGEFSSLAVCRIRGPRSMQMCYALTVGPPT